MKKNVLVILLLIVFAACSKKNDQGNPPPKDLPVWLQVRITEMKKDPKNKGAIIEKYSWNNSVYYNIRLIYMSCMLCELRDADGTAFDKTLMADFVAHHQRIGTVWTFE
ncbi:hypothetical protein LQ567_11405 [Niabella pedocola]|uniref:Uncharacterized protein n=1 Tax=Niabella pedocola TaxID=1752077 RepID=A0ABS8PR84_9BACT|nr:hypothetical protein [Niabella pedocola]MCD2423370.1 hypothetical protein [Niabella pedocola]